MSLHDPAHLAARLSAAANRAARSRTGEFSLEGTRLLERALRAGVELRAVLASSSFGASDREAALLAALESAQSPVVRIDDEELARLTGGRTFGAALGLATRPEPLTSAPTSGPVLVLSDVVDPGNVGALCRTACAAGASALYAVGDTDLFHPKAVRTSMGSLFKLPYRECTGDEEALDELSAAQFTTLAAVTEGGDAPWNLDPQRAPFAVFVGSEAHGLSTPSSLACAQRVTLPQRAGVDSYSVNAAAAMLLYELGRPNQPR